MRVQPKKDYRGRPCFCWCLMLCCSVLVIILLVFTILVATFSLPSADIKQLSNGSPPFELESSTGSSPVSLRMNLIMTTEIRNPNFYGLKVKNVHVRLFYKPTNVQLGAVMKDEIDFKANEVFTEDLPIVLFLNTDDLETYQVISIEK